MTDTFTELIYDIAQSRNGKESLYLTELIEGLFDCLDGDFTSLEKRFHCCISETIEKHNPLQFTHYIEITSDLVEATLYLEFENGINNGTQLNSYCFESSLIPHYREHEVLVDVELDCSHYKTEWEIQRAKAVLNVHKSEILQLLKDRSYDNYVTGGGTSKTNKFYSAKLDKYSKMNLHWVANYDTVKADLNIIK